MRGSGFHGDISLVKPGHVPRTAVPVAKPRLSDLASIK
jgi:hypothetical protein